MAIVMVLVFAMLMAILGLYIAKTNEHQYRQERLSHHQLQAHLMARAGVEHALLKAKFLHRQLYDAAALAQYRNPLYDFSQGMSGIGPYNPGPIFTYRAGEGVNSGFYTDPSSVHLSGVIRTRPDRWLDVFRLDISTGVDGNSGDIDYRPHLVNGVLALTQTGPLEIRGKMLEPYIAQYQATRIDVLARQIDASVAATNHEIVEFTIVATVINARGDIWTEEIKKVVRVTRQ